MKIVVFEVEEWEEEAFTGLRDEHDLTLTNQKLTARNADQYAETEIVSVFIYSELTSEVLSKLENLKMIATRSTGFNHIDLDYCQEHDIVVANVPTYGTHTVAEHVFGLLLTLSHRLHEAIDRTRRGSFMTRDLTGFDLRGKTMGVIGTGDIGIETIRIARGFLMEILAFDIKPDQEAARELGFRYVGMDELLAESDIISLHVPSNPKTHHMISNDEFKKMKQGVVIINTARGDVLDVRALARALADGKVAAAGLDVLPEEPVIGEEAELLRSAFERSHNLDTLLMDQVLIRMRNVVVTPHNAFNTREARFRLLDTTVENIQAFVGAKPKNAVVSG